MGNALGNSLILIINTLGGLYLLVILVRFLLQAARADFYNPVSQAIVKATSPLLSPLQKVIPPYQRIDFATLVLALIVNSVFTALIIFIAEPNAFPSLNIGSFLIWGGIGALSLLLKIYYWGLLISIISSWIAPYSGNPILLLVQQLLYPVQSRLRKIIPSMGGLDISPIFLFLGLRILDGNVVGYLAQNFSLPAQYVIGI